MWCTVSSSGRFDRNNTGGASVFNFFHNEDEVRLACVGFFTWILGTLVLKCWL